MFRKRLYVTSQPITFKAEVGDHGTVFIQCMPNFLQNGSVLTLLSTTSSRHISLTTEMDTLYCLQSIRAKFPS